MKIFLFIVFLVCFSKWCTKIKNKQNIQYFFPITENTTADGSSSSSCGDWEQYKDEHCYRLFDSLVSFSDAEKVCQTNNSSMVSIHYAEEQAFLSNFIFTKKKIVDNVWIGARYAGNGLYQWEDHSQLTVQGYSNWAPGFPKNLTDHCVEMLAEEGANLGRWFEERCAKRNMVVCQRAPPTSMTLLAEAVFQLKHNSQQMLTRLKEAERKVAQLAKESLPIGFTYVQLPKDKPPSELWPSMTWADVSADYEGVFFRVVGGDAASFGQLQPGNAPRLGTVHVSYGGDNLIKESHSSPFNLTVPASGWSDGIHTGGDEGSTRYYMNFRLTDGAAEVRPKNMAVKVYKRTA